MEQLELTPGGVDGNSALILSRLKASLSDGADIVVFPELANSGYIVDPNVVRQIAQPLDGPFVHSLTRTVSELGGLVAAGFCEVEDDSFYNSVVLVGQDGPLLHYRKLHLFAEEKNVFSVGNTLPVAETDYGKIGICICYDLRFVEVLRVLSLRDCDIVLAPAAWVAGFDQTVPETGLTRQAESVVTQANLNQVAVVAVSQVTESPVPDGVNALGGSVAVDAFGTVIGRALSRTKTESLLVDIDVDGGRSARIRSGLIRPRSDRRTDVYGLQYGEELL